LRYIDKLILYDKISPDTRTDSKEHQLDINNPRHQQVLIEAVEGALPIIRENIGGHLPESAEVKENATLVTITDNEVQSHLLPILRENFPDVEINAEEKGGDVGRGRIKFKVDPLDGTRGFSNGMASATVIIGVYDPGEKQVTGCVIGEASMGRIWYAFGDSPTMLRRPGRKSIPVSVWKGETDEQSSVFLDVSHGFQRGDRDILNDFWVAGIFKELGYRSKIFLPGSNGLMQALVANGGQKMAASITTAIGGPWDVCGVKLVLNAGGAARAFRAEETGEMYPARVFVERNPLDVMDYDILVCGNSKETVKSIVEWMPIPVAT
jgi:fructose-1,6-bisphosphatase/inositol monophosphatase family enzyme